MKDKDLSLEGLRGLASLIVVIGHFAFVAMPFLATPFYPSAASAGTIFETIAVLPPFSLLFSAEAAVCIFFVMSGYVLSKKFFETGKIESLQSAAIKRYIRLAIPTAASILFAWSLLNLGLILTQRAPDIGAAGWVSSWYVRNDDLFGAIWNAFVGGPLFSHTEYNPPIWTIQVELIGSIYLFSMLALFSGRPIAFLLWSSFFATLLGFNAPNALFYLCFVFGAMINKIDLNEHQILANLIGALGMIGVCYNLSSPFDFMRIVPLPNLQPYGPDFNQNSQLFWHSIGGVLLVIGTVNSRAARCFLSGRVPVFLGKISFSMYLTHMPILMSFGLGLLWVAKGMGFPHLESALAALAFYLAAVLALSTSFYQYVDAPATRLSSAFTVAKRKKTEIMGPSISDPVIGVDDLTQARLEKSVATSR